MKFIDEARIKVEAGKGGDGCASFRREKFIAFGGPNGGDGGNGGSIYLKADIGITTLADFRYKKNYRAKDGQNGYGQECSGKNGSDLIIIVPVGTLVFDSDTMEKIADMNKDQQTIIIAKGGSKGLGNIHFKSSTNRAPRSFTKGGPGEVKNLLLELQVLADVGLLGMPNAGKSTFIRSVSQARPKVADYMFTTIYPNLGVVDMGANGSFVIADIPGLIPGAAQGIGLGVRFLKHLKRTSILLHIIDINPPDGSDPVASANKILHEMAQFDPALLQKERWLILNKADLLPKHLSDEHCASIVRSLNWTGRVYTISAINKQGTKQICYDLMEYINSSKNIQNNQM